MRSAGRRDLDRLPAPVGAGQRRARQQRDALVRTEAGQRPDERFGLENPRVRGEEGRGRAHVRLARADRGGVQQHQSLDAVGDAARAERLERGDLPTVVRHDEFAAAGMRHVVSRAEVVEQPGPLHAVPRLERTFRIIDAGVDDLAVVRARGRAESRLPFEHADAAAAPADGERRREADDAPSDDCRVDAFHDVCAVRVLAVRSSRMRPRGARRPPSRPP